MARDSFLLRCCGQPLPPPIDTERHAVTITTLSPSPSLRLVPVSVADAGALAQLVSANLAQLAAWLPAVAVLGSSTAAHDYLEGAVAAVAHGQLLEWHVRVNGVLAGAIRIKDIDAANRKAALGYYIGDAHQRQGVASAAARAVLDYCFDTFALNRIEVRCASTNLASERLALRLGFVHEGTLRQDEWLNGVPVDHLVFGLLRADHARDCARPACLT